MCGIIATITTDTYATNLDDWFRDALLTSQVRGMHSTGIFQLKKDHKSFRMFKRAVNASNFVGIRDVQEIISDVPRSPLTIGHVRHATVGAHTDTNAHPFVAMNGNRRIVGVHNGTLQGWRDKAGGGLQNVDSAWAFDMFAQHGPIDAFEYFDGAFAYAWHDSEYPDHLWVARNEERPMHFFLSEDRKTMMFASELGMLGWITERNKFPRTKDHNFAFLSPEKIYKFSLKEVGKYTTYDRPAHDPKTTVQKSTSTPVRHYAGRSAWFEDDAYGDWGHGQGYVRSYSSWSGYRRQGHVLASVKKALADARREIAEEKLAAGNNSDAESVVDGAELDKRLENGIKAAIETFQGAKEFDTWALCGERFKINEPNVRNVTQAEIESARKLGMFGVAVAFNGIMFDEDLCELLGEAYAKVPDYGVESIQKYDCIMRGMSKGASDSQYINVHNAVPVVVVGAVDGIQEGEVCFIVSSVSKETIADLQKKLSAQTSSSSVH